jgi:hypothetical protein
MMGTAKHIGRVGALAVALGVGNFRAVATRVAVSIGVAAVVVAATVVPAPVSTVSPAVKLSADSTALIMGASTIPTPDEFWVESVKNQFIAPTHPGQAIDYVAVTTPEEVWPTGLPRLLFSVFGPPEIWAPGSSAWPNEPWWKLAGLFDLTWDQSVQAGVADLETAMAAHGNDHLVIYGYSQGSTVAILEKRKLAEQYPAGTTAPDIDFVLGGDGNLPNGGFLARFPGLHIPILDISFNGPEPTDTQFHTDVITRQYDGFADFPLYPLNLVADVNALLGFLYVHLYPFDVSLAPDASTSPAYQGTHGDTSYYFFQTQHLPLFAPLRALGVPEPLIDIVEPFFRAIVELGYDRTIPPWEPTPARLIPPLDPAKVTADLVNAIGKGITNAAALISSPAPLSSPTPLANAAAAPAQAAADTGVASLQAATTATTESGTESSQRPTTELSAVASMPNLTTSAQGSATNTGSDSGKTAPAPNPATSSSTTESSVTTNAGSSASHSTRTPVTSPSAGNATKSSADTTTGPSASPSTPKPAHLGGQPTPRPVLRAPLRTRPQLRDVINHDTANQPATGVGDTQSTAESSAPAPSS